MKELVGAGLLVLGLSSAAADGERRCMLMTVRQHTAFERATEGIAAINGGDPEAAIALLGEATQIEPTNPWAWYNLGLAYEWQDHYAGAAAAYAQATAIVDDDAMSHFKLGYARYKAIDPSTSSFSADDLAPARVELERAIELEPRLHRAHYYLGRIHRHLGNATATAEAFTRAIALAPRVIDPYIALGELYRRWGYVDEAVKVLHQGVSNGQGEADELAELRFALGLAYADKNEHAAAIAQFDDAVAYQPALHQARYARGMSRYRTGQDDAAREDLEAYVLAESGAFTADLARKALLEIAARQP